MIRWKWQKILLLRKMCNNDTNTESTTCSCEVTETELLDVEHGGEIVHLPNSSNNSVTSAKLLINIRKSNNSKKNRIIS